MFKFKVGNSINFMYDGPNGIVFEYINFNDDGTIDTNITNFQFLKDTPWKALRNYFLQAVQCDDLDNLALDSDAITRRINLTRQLEKLQAEKVEQDITRQLEILRANLTGIVPAKEWNN